MADPTRRRGRPCADGPDRPLTVQALDRALDMLDLLSLHPGLTLSEVAQRTGLPASATHRILQTLALRGMVERCAATQCWSVGPSSFRLGAAFLRRSGLIARARPILQDLVARTQETANLGILSDGGVLFVSQVESDQPIRVAFPPGTRASLTGSGIGRAMLAINAGPAPDTACPDLAHIRRQGFAFDDQGRMAGMRCVAAPIVDMAGRAVAGLSINAPAHRIGTRQVGAIGAAVAEAAARLTAVTGEQLHL